LRTCVRELLACREGTSRNRDRCFLCQIAQKNYASQAMAMGEEKKTPIEQKYRHRVFMPIHLDDVIQMECIQRYDEKIHMLLASDRKPQKSFLVCYV
jgi:hypothetical protein